ncbi:membrane protein (plasmid) [Paraburkholderia terrae]|uniref:Membrane protein n=1 Tax=Paraburkholderia terrae TaxID=311230 RepID=A0ABM7U2Y4_9BURK|nr:DUF4148 domain-containing protein [Paraburkholderia terrae]BCZ85612.1 membrane protein [Paraburkholderia terrae]
MKSLLSATVTALLLVAPVASFAQQSDRAASRAEVRMELSRLVAAGYRPASDHNRYPANIQAAQQRLDHQQFASSAADAESYLVSTSVGEEAHAALEAGKPSDKSGRDSIYRGH